jgi:hypothetical protein
VLSGIDQAIGGGKVRSHTADDLAHRLRVPVEELVGARHSCDVTLDDVGRPTTTTSSSTTPHVRMPHSDGATKVVDEFAASTDEAGDFTTGQSSVLTR